MTILVLIFGEVLPEILCKVSCRKNGVVCGICTFCIYRCYDPVREDFRCIISGMKPKTEAPSVTEDELKYIIDEIEEEGVLEEQESDLVLSACSLMKLPSTTF